MTVFPADSFFLLLSTSWGGVSARALTEGYAVCSKEGYRHKDRPYGAGAGNVPLHRSAVPLPTMWGGEVEVIRG